MNHLEKFGRVLEEAAGDPAVASNSRLQNLVCIGIPIYNTFAVLYGLPSLPLPAFCTTPPAPTPVPPAPPSS